MCVMDCGRSDEHCSVAVTLALFQRCRGSDRHEHRARLVITNQSLHRLFSYDSGGLVDPDQPFAYHQVTETTSHRRNVGKKRGDAR